VAALLEAALLEAALLEAALLEAALLEATLRPLGSLARARGRIMPVVALPAAAPFHQSALPTERSP
jgi:hypothetical protein